MASPGRAPDSTAVPMRRDTGRPAFVVVLLAGFALTALLVAGATATAESARKSRFDQRAQILADNIESQISSAAEVLYALRALYAIEPDLTRGEFQAYATQLQADTRTPGLRAVEHAAVVPRERLPDFVAAVRSDSTLSGPARAAFEVLQPAAEGEHVVIDVVHPLADNEAAMGLDLRGSPSRRSAVDRARDSGELVATEPIDLVQDASRAFLLTLPLYAGGAATEPTVEGRRSSFDGLIVAIVHVGDLLAPQLGTAVNIEVELLDLGLSGMPVSVEDAAELHDPEGDLRAARGASGQPDARFDLDVGGRRWLLFIAATPDFGDPAPLLPVAVGAGGVAASLLGAALAGSVAGGRAHRRRQIFESFLEFAPDAVVVVDTAGRIARVNRQAEALFGYDRTELVGQEVERLIPADLRNVHKQHVAAFVRSPTARPMGRDRELLGTRKDGTTFAVDVSLSPIEGEAGPMFAAAIRDVTDRRRTEHALVEAAEQLRSASSLKDQFLDVTTHELRTPLAAIEGFAEVLTVDADLLDAPARAELIERIAVNAREMRSMVDRLMELSRIDADRVRLDVHELELRTVIEAVLASSPSDGGHILRTTVADDVIVRADPGALRQVLSDLVSNAVKFSPPGTTVTVSAVDLGKDVEVQVIDEGPGIADAEQAGLFEHFVHGSALAPTGRRGAGIGLAIVKRYVEMLGGTVGVRSLRGHGSTFWFTVPVGHEEGRRT